MTDDSQKDSSYDWLSAAKKLMRDVQAGNATTEDATLNFLGATHAAEEAEGEFWAKRQLKRMEAESPTAEKEPPAR